MEFLGRNRWTTETPDIEINYYYEHQRSGANMQYRVKTVIEPVVSPRSFGYPILAKVYMDGNEVIGETTLKPNNTYTWSSNKEWTSDWITISNKTVGTTSLAFNIYSSGSSRNATYNYSMTVDPAYTSVTQWSVSSKTETSITLTWKTADVCSQIRYGTSTSSYTTANVNSNSGSVTISGLTANTGYTLYFMPKRKDSNLWGNGGDGQWASVGQTTYNYPYCTSAPSFTIGNSVTLQFYNPRNRTFTLRLWSYKGSTFITDNINVSGTSYTFTPNATRLYQSIPNNKNSQYSVDCTTDGHKLSVNGGYYSVNESTNKPTFSDFDYEDTNATTLALTGDSSIVVKGYSNIKATILEENKATAKNYATMSRYNLSIGNAISSVNYSDNDDVSTTLNGATSGTIIVYAEDSRGLTTPITKNATLKAYTNIERGSISIARQNNVGEAVTLNFSGNFWNNSFGDINNDIVEVKYRYKKTTESWPVPTVWNGTTTITPSKTGNTYSYNGGIVGDISGTGFNVSDSYNIEIMVSDKLSSTTFTTTLGSGTPNIAIESGGVAINGKYDTTKDDGLQVNGKIYRNGTELVIPTFDTAVSTTSTNGVQNKVITNYVNDKLPKMIVSDQPFDNSTATVTLPSGNGIYIVLTTHVLSGANGGMYTFQTNPNFNAVICAIKADSNVTSISVTNRNTFTIKTNATRNLSIIKIK